MNYLKRQEGVVLPLLIGLVALVVVVIGLALWQSQHAKTIASQASPSPSSSVASSESPATSATPTPIGTIFTIKELGIQFTTTDDLKDLVYVVQTHNGLTAAYFSTTSLEAADKNAGGTYCTPQGDAPIGVVDLGSSTPGGEQAIKMIGSKYLNYTHSQSVCSQNSSVMSLANKQAQAFVQALSTAEAVQ